jgi:L-lysine exporter family protein LysE/ArgO
MSADLLPILLQGIALGAGLCFTLGPQSVFVLRQGMRGERALQVATICSLSDVAMIVAGAAGFGGLLAAFPSFTTLAGWGSAALVVVYGAMQLTGALLRGRERRAASPIAVRAASCAIAPAVAFSLLNPQVYLEMVGVVGSVALRFAEAERAAFALGVMLVSPLWFFGLALAGRRLAALARCQRAAFVLDLATASLMLGLGTAMALAESGLPYAMR